MISAISTAKLPHIWEKVAPLLQKAIDKSHGDVTLESTINGLLNGTSWLFVVSDENGIHAAITAGVDTYESGKRVLMLRLAGGGSLELWKEDSLNLFRQLAREQMCQDLRLIGRKGWERVARPLGGESIQSIISFGV